MSVSSDVDPMRQIGVIGLGNPLRHDDGIGLVLLNRLQQRKETFKKKITFADGGTGGMNLLHLLSRFDTILIIDAVDFNGKPGDSHVFSFEQIQSKKIPVSLSTHETDFVTVLTLSKELNELPTMLVLFGVQPYDVSYGTGLSKQITSHLDIIYSNLKDEVQKLIEKS